MGRRTVKSGVIATASPRWQALIDGDLKVEDLDDEELLAGRLKNEQGVLAPRGINAVPRQLHERMMRELKHRMQGRFAEQIDAAIEQLVWVMHYGETRDMVKLQAAQTIIERVLGKVESKSTLTVETTPWQEALESGELLVDVEHPEVVDVEVIDDLPTNAPARARTPVRRRGTQ